LSALVDVPGDQDYRQSRNVYFEAERLRQAAPDMLQALHAASHYLADHMDKSNPSAVRVYEQLRAAIAKAKRAQDHSGPGKDWLSRSTRRTGHAPPLP
jgi:hypothetical protein